MVPKSQPGVGLLSERVCDLEIGMLLLDCSGFPALEYLGLDFNNSIRTESERFLVGALKRNRVSTTLILSDLQVLRVIGKVKTIGPKRDDGMAVGLRRLTIRGLDYKPLQEELRCLLALGGRYVVE